jgi:hypothetical protein
VEKNRYRILYSFTHWTPVRREVFEEVLPFCKRTLEQIIYLKLYDKVCHSKARRIDASSIDLAKWTCADWRTVDKCLFVLQYKGFIVRRAYGTRKSRSDKPCWRVPLAEFDFRNKGPWTPVPRFLIQEYPRFYPPAVLLLILHWRQHIGWNDHCWPGATRLAKDTGWSRRKVYAALRTMGHQNIWTKLGGDLPWPLEVFWRTNKEGKQRRHFRIRAVFYKSKKGKALPLVGLSPDFAKHFRLRRWHGQIDVNRSNSDGI